MGYPLGERTKICSGYVGHMTKIAAVSTYVKNVKKIFFFGTKSLTILKFGMEHWGHKVYKVCINDDYWVTLTNLTAMSNVGNFFMLILGSEIR